MAGVWIPPGKQRFVDPATGEAMVGGKVYHYVPNTDTPKDTYTDQAQTSLNTNPIILDGDGECTIWGEGLYRQKLYDADNNPIWDEVTGFTGGGGGSVTFATPSEVAALSDPTLVISPYALGASGVLGGSGGSGYGWAKPLSDYATLDLSGVTVGGNDTAFAAAEADTSINHFYIPAGTLRTNLTASQLTKGYKGDGAIVAGPGAPANPGDGSFRPANFSYMSVLPSTWPTQGANGWFRPDQRFTDSGEWKIIGTGVRTYNPTQRYFESVVIPHSAWLDVLSGNSGVQAYLTSGASAGAQTITINGPASIDWIGKTVVFALGMDGAAQETRVVDSVAGSTIHITVPLSNSYTWNPSIGVAGQPCIYFGKRTWAGQQYVKLQAGGGGDFYGHLVRTSMTYQPKASELAHPFMAGTASQYGGDVYAGADGQFLQFFESQIQAQTYDISAMGFTLDFVRNKDFILQQGRFMGGIWMQSGGDRPFDVGVTIAGFWRNGIDTGFASLYETSYLLNQTIASATNILVRSVNGAHPNDPITIGEVGAVLYTGTIVSVNAGAGVIQVTPALPVTPIVVNTLVTYPKGGAALNMAQNHRIIWNSTVTRDDRSGDAMGVYPSFYGNHQGDLIMESGNDGSEYWSVRFARGTSNTLPDTARIRLRATGVNIFGTGLTTIAGTGLGLAAGCSLTMVVGTQIIMGNGILRYNGSIWERSNNGGVSFSPF